MTPLLTTLWAYCKCPETKCTRVLLFLSDSWKSYCMSEAFFSEQIEKKTSFQGAAQHVLDYSLFPSEPPTIGYILITDGKSSNYNILDFQEICTHLRPVMICNESISTNFIPTFQDDSIVTGTVQRFPKCQWNSPEEYRKEIIWLPQKTPI